MQLSFYGVLSFVVTVLLSISLFYHLRFKLRLWNAKEVLYYQGTRYCRNKLFNLFLFKESTMVNGLIVLWLGIIIVEIIQFIFFNIELTETYFVFASSCAGFINSKNHRKLVVTKRGINTFSNFIGWKQIKSYDLQTEGLTNEDILNINLLDSKKTYSIKVSKGEEEKLERILEKNIG